MGSSSSLALRSCPVGTNVRQSRSLQPARLAGPCRDSARLQRYSVVRRSFARRELRPAGPASGFGGRFSGAHLPLPIMHHLHHDRLSLAIYTSSFFQLAFSVSDLNVIVPVSSPSLLR